MRLNSDLLEVQLYLCSAKRARRLCSLDSRFCLTLNKTKPAIKSDGIISVFLNIELISPESKKHKWHCN